MFERRPIVPALILLALAAFLGSCSTTEPEVVTPVVIPAASMSYIVLAWNDTGMHFLNSTYNGAVYQPPYNTLCAQVVKRGDPPEIVTAGVTLEYAIVGNTYSYGKSTADPDPVRDYAQFWDHALELFDVDLAHDTGLNFTDPDVHNGLAGTMLLKGERFEATGVPVVPINDAGTWDPYQVAEVVVRDASSGVELARTRTMAQTSDEINCGKCHGQTINDREIGSVLKEHDDSHETTFVEDGVPVLCADCHGSPILGTTGPGSAEKYLSYAIHIFHYDQKCRLLRLPSGDDDPGQPEHGAYDRQRQLHDLPRQPDGPRGHHRQRARALGDRAEMRELPHLRGRGQHGIGPLPERPGPRRPIVPRLPRPGARPGPLRQGSGQLPGPPIPGQGDVPGKLQGLPQHLEGRRHQRGRRGPRRQRAHGLRRLPHRADHDEQSAAVPAPFPAADPLGAR